MAQLEMIVYEPPLEGYPYLAVALKPDGDVSALAFATKDEASFFVEQMTVARQGTSQASTPVAATLRERNGF